MATTARIRRILSDYEQVKKDFTGHSYIVVKPNDIELPENFFVTYFVNGIYLLPDGRIEQLGRHEVEITLHAEYPRYKPICKINTPIWHPNFRDGQICIGDIWGAGESLSDIIINIGDMIQYKSWNSFSPLSADAAEWAIKNKHLFPVGTLELHKADYTATAKDIEINLFDDNNIIIEESIATEKMQSQATVAEMQSDVVTSITADELNNSPQAATSIANTAAEISEAATAPQVPVIPVKASVITENIKLNDFEITAYDLAGIQYVPTAQRMQSLQHGQVASGKKINFKTILMKGLLWGLIGGLIGWVLQEVIDINAEMVLSWMGYELTENALTNNENALSIFVPIAIRVSSAFFSMFIAIALGAFLGLGEGVYYGSKENALKYMGLGAGIAAVVGFISGYIAQALYSALLTEVDYDFKSAFVRGIGWAVMGVGVGLAVGLIKPEKKRITFCCVGGLCGGFIGGFIFNYICLAVSSETGVLSRAVGIVLMGLLIGLGIGLLEQFAKAAWLKVVRGEFEGKEYLVFAGITSIGNNGKNTIALFKDKLVGPNHCDIILEGNKYVLIDKGTPMGTVVNGQRIARHILRRGDTIAIGNSVLVFNTK